PCQSRRRPPPRPPRRSPRGRSSRGSRGGASFARSTSSSGVTLCPSSCLAISLRPIRPRALSTSWTSTSSTSPRWITSSMWPTRPGPTLETCSRPSVPFFSSTNAPKSVVLTTFPVYSSPTSGSFVSAWIAELAASACRPDVVLGLERADRLAALADHHPDEVRVDLDRRDPRSRLGQLGARLRDHLEHLVDDRVARPLGLLERVPHDLLRHAG